MIVNDTIPCFDGIVLSVATQPRCRVQCREGFIMSGFSTLSNVVMTEATWSNIFSVMSMCSPYVFPEGVTGSTGSNGCVQNESLSAVTQPVCDLACQSGYSPSNTEPPTLHCNITGGLPWSHFTCDENTCDALTLPLGVVAAVGSNSSCTNGAVLTAVNSPSCDVSCASTHSIVAGTEMFQCPIGGGFSFTTLRCSENHCNSFSPLERV